MGVLVVSTNCASNSILVQAHSGERAFASHALGRRQVVPPLLKIGSNNHGSAPNTSGVLHGVRSRHNARQSANGLGPLGAIVN